MMNRGHYILLDLLYEAGFLEEALKAFEQDIF